MKRLGNFFATAFIAAFLVSCGDDAPVPENGVPHFDNTMMEGTYVGTCELLIPNLADKDTIIRETTVRLDKTNEKFVLALYTDETGLIFDKSLLQDFKQSRDKKTYTFNIGGFNVEYAYTKNKDNYIHQWFGVAFSDGIEDINIEILPSPSSATYTIETKTLTFAFEGTVTFTGVTGNIKTPVDYKIQYKYEVTQVEK
ncbi:MAG: hypothetical protein LBF08_07200 [Dysgonamonadaceae bacterium]|jgi:hypothetical protein|nr:hypothetical protein [Dysgonamonadaceae bacterium]